MNNTITRQTWQIIVLLLFSSVNKALIIRLTQLFMTAVRFLKSDLTKQLSCASQVKDYSVITWFKKKGVIKKVFATKIIINHSWYHISAHREAADRSGQPEHSCGQAIETLSVHFIHDKIQCIEYILFVWTNGKYAFLEPSLMQVKAFW